MRKKNREAKLRGRKDKYYEQVDNEDQSFADSNHRLQHDLDDDDERMLD